MEQKLVDRSLRQSRRSVLCVAVNPAPDAHLASIWLLVVVIAAEETHPGLVTTDTEQDLIAEASQTAGVQAQKRESGLTNSYGEPLLADVYGPPQNNPITVTDQPPPPVYGVPESTAFVETPPGAYGPPAPVVFPNQNYEGPPPPIIKPKQLYGPPKFHIPKQTYGPPKPVYGPPKKTYGPPKQSFPKQFYGLPLKPPKITYPKPIYGAPKPTHGAPKPVYGPPKITYGAPNFQNIPFKDVPLSLPQNFGSSTNFGHIGVGTGNIGVGTIGTHFGSLETSVSTSIGTNDLNLNLPAPIYGTPLPSLPQDLKPNFPIPADTYGPPGHSLGPLGPNDQLVVQNIDNIGHYGPPQPDPNPRPPHPGIPAPPTPPHVIYDGWTPIPGVSKPSLANIDINTLQSIENFGHNGDHVDQYGPPPIIQEVINLDGNQPNINQNVHFLDTEINSGYSNVHQDALANIDINAIVGGHSNNIDQSKTIYEAHITDNRPNPDFGLIQALPEKPAEIFSVPNKDSFVSGHYPLSFRQQGAKGLIPPSGQYGVPPGSQYGAPPKPHPVNLPLPYGSYSGGGYSVHTGGPSPRHPIKFRDSVPEGLIQQIGHVSHHKDTHGIDHIKQGPAYISPPIPARDINQQSINHGISLMIEPSNLFSLPHGGNPISFQTQEPNNLYGSPIDSYSAPLLTVSDHTASGSSNELVTATLDGTILSNLSSLDAAAILKHCPYHEAILKAARLGEKIPSDLASRYVASLKSLGSKLQNNQKTPAASHNDFNAPITGSDSNLYDTKDLSTAPQTLIETVLPNHIKNYETKEERGKPIKDTYRHNIQHVSNQIQETSAKIRTLNENTNNLQHLIDSSNKIITENGHVNFDQSEIPSKGKLGSYSVQIQSANGDSGKSNSPTIPHEQLLSEDLLQSILHAIEEPRENQRNNKVEIIESPVNANNQQVILSSFNQNNEQTFSTVNTDGGLVLPEGYEPIDRSKDKVQIDQDPQNSNIDISIAPHNEALAKHKESFKDCDSRPDNSVTHTIVVPPPGVENVQRVDEIGDNDVAIYFNEESKNSKESNEEIPQEAVTEISVATSISENSEKSDKEPEFGVKIDKKS